MDKMVDHLFVFDGTGNIKDIVGNYTAYRSQLIADQKEEKRLVVAEKKESKKQIPVEEKIRTEKKKRLSFKEREEFKQLEKDLDSLEILKEELTMKLSDSTLASQEIVEIGNQLSETVKSLEEKTDRWLELSEYDSF